MLWFCHRNQQHTQTMTISYTFRQSLYWILLVISSVLCIWLIYINVNEIIQRNLGHHTVFSQMSWLTDRQAVLYCVCSTLVFAFLLTSIGYNFIQRNKRQTIILCIATLLIAISSFILETLFFYYKPV